ncbi:carbohydrate ABC transporter permease [Candidatus Poribacteria bacterium]|nr:carbohydrate ABC transporter permease [Candidatus Poribacteria bacterium]MYF56833.1 carbohydrate ABC transporter permease [Candidatus Poribacteria bacterium]
MSRFINRLLILLKRSIALSFAALKSIYKWFLGILPVLLKILIFSLIAFAVITYILPIIWILLTSLKARVDINTKLPKFLFAVSVENYLKLIPEGGLPFATYLFFIQTILGLIIYTLFSFIKNPFKKYISTRTLGIIWNSIFIVTCIFSFFSTEPTQSRLQVDVRYQFFSLIICSVVAYLLINPWKKNRINLHEVSNGLAVNDRKENLTFLIPVILSTVGVFICLANGGSNFFYQLLNSIIVGGGSTILAVGLGTIAAYAFSRFDIAGKEDLLFFILSTRMLPPIVVVIPIYLMYISLKLIDTHFGLILLYTTFNVSFAVWLMKGFIDEIPREYEDAALVDGYTRFQTFLKVVLPQSVTGIAATAVFCLITAWNEFAFALVLTETGGRAVTAPPSITSATGSAGMDWGKIAASTFIFLLPVAIFTFLMRSHLLRGVTFGAVKK